ncbi:MAG: DUF6502 family protein [Wenzhouxiangellaceae bacterium]
MSATNTASDSQHDQGARLASAIERVIRPFIRLIVGRVSCDFLVQQIKRIYIEEARSWIEKNDQHGRVTKSKLAMLTGLDTRTISAIEAEQQVGNEFRIGDLCPEAGVLEKWRTSKSFTDDEGNPKVLPIFGKSIAFQALVSSIVGRNVTCQTVLERLLDSGNVEIFDGDFVRLLNPFYQPVNSSDETLIDAGSWSIARLTETVALNLDALGSEERLLQQDRWSRRIPAECEEDLLNDARALLDRQIIEFEQLLEKYEASERQEGQKTFGVGWFSFTR